MADEVRGLLEAVAAHPFGALFLGVVWGVTITALSQWRLFVVEGNKAVTNMRE